MGSKRLLALIACIFAALLVLAGPAAMAGGGDKDGDADSDTSTAYTEDTDTNDGGTADGVEDEGDNAHPSGKDKSVEHGNSGTQGKSESNPDDSKGPMRYEGELGDDKANGPGGSDLADQDGNNGCGNDDDFDDDNNGWCGKPTENGGGGENPPGGGGGNPPGGGGGNPPGGGGNPPGGGGQVPPEDEVLGEVVNRPSSGDTAGDAVEDSVLGTAEEAPAAAALPFTGAALIPFAALGLGLIGSGTALVRRRSR